MKEVWRDIKGFSKYKISNLGRVVNISTNKILKPLLLTKGYFGVRLYYERGRAVTKKIHRLVASIFISNPNHLPQVNHIDGNKGNNAVTNLEWRTNDYNMNHALNNHLVSQGESKVNSKCTNNSLLLLQELINCGFTIKQLSIIYGVSKNVMAQIVNNKTYRKLHLNIQYNNPAEKKFNHKFISLNLYNKLNDTLRDNTMLNTLIANNIISVSV